MKPSRIPPPPVALKTPPPSLWEPCRLFLAVLGGLFMIAILAGFLKGDESEQFTNFLRGQSGFDGITSLLFWKMACGFAIGAMAGYFLFLELPAAHRKYANSLALALALFFIPVIVYIPAMSAGFLWDDDQEITANASILHIPRVPNPASTADFKTNWRGLWEIWTGGITSDKDDDHERATAPQPKPPAPFLVRKLRPPLRAMELWMFGGENKANYRFTANQSADYFPLKTTMLWIEYQLWGQELLMPTQPRADGDFVINGFHVMNILIHALDGLLLWMVLRQLKVPGAWLGSLLFVIHPVHAESVAWIAERKNTLSLCFCLLSLSAWLRFEDAGKRSHYAWAMVLFLASLLCKTHVVVFPAVLLLIVWWRNSRITLRDVARSAPFFIIALALALVTIWFQNDRAIGGEEIPIGNAASRIAGAGVVVWSYLAKALVPINLNTIYADTWYLWWPLTNPQPWMFLASALVPMTFALLWALMVLYPSRNPITGRTPFFVFAFFVGTLFPVLGLLKMSYMRLTLQADHFQYFSDLSIVAFVGAVVATLYGKASAAWRPILVAACTVAVFSCCAYSWERAGVHQSEKTLWTACLEKNDASWQAHNHIGAVLYSESTVLERTGQHLLAEQKILESAPHFARAVVLKPANPEVHNNLGLVLWHAKRYPEAIAQYRQAVQIKGDVPALRRNLAEALIQLNQNQEAIEQYQIMIKEAPGDPNLRINLGVAYAKIKKFKEAREAFEAAMKIDPSNPMIRQNYEFLKRQEN